MKIKFKELAQSLWKKEGSPQDGYTQFIEQSRELLNSAIKRKNIKN